VLCMKMDAFDKAFLDLKKEQKQSPFNSFGLEYPLSTVPGLTTTDVFVNYAEPVQLISKHLFATLLNKDKNERRQILLVGSAGAGKSTLLEYLFERSQDYEKHGKFKSSGMKDISIWMGASAKALEQDDVERRIGAMVVNQATGVFFLDDIQELLFSEKYFGKKIIEVYRKIDESLKAFEGLVISTVTPRFFEEMISQPEIFSFYHEVIFLDGISPEHMTELIRKRLNALKLDPVQSNFDPFESGVLDCIIEGSMKNPRLLLEMTDNCIIEAHRFEEKKISLRACKQIVEKNSNLLKKIDELTPTLKETLNNCAISALVSTQDISRISKKERNTISEHLNELVRLGLLEKKPSEDKEKITYFILPTVVRTKVDLYYSDRAKDQFSLLKLKKF